VVLGSDVLYEAYQAAALAATLRQTLAPGGKAFLCCPVREQVWPRMHAALANADLSGQVTAPPSLCLMERGAARLMT
jgi:hypothetical protein